MARAKRSGKTPQGRDRFADLLIEPGGKRNISLKMSPAVVSLSSVNRLKTIVAVVLLALWVPITSHCLLERVSGLPFLACASDDATKGNCDDDADGCQTVESASYRTEDSQPVVADFTFAIALLAPAVSFASPPLKDSAVALFAEPPSDLPSAWQFTFRTALPPRAPSFAS